MDNVEDYTSYNIVGCHQDADHAQFPNILQSVSGIIHTLLGVDVWWNFQIYPAVSSDSTDGEICCL